MRPKRTALDVEADLFEPELDVMMQKFQPGFVRHAHPYDARASKVRERANSPDGHHELAVAAGDGRGARSDFIEAVLGDVAEKFQGQMQRRLLHPGKLR